MFEFSLKNQNELSRQSNSYKLFNYCDYYENYKFNYYKNYKFKNRRQPDNICVRNKSSLLVGLVPNLRSPIERQFAE